jgi:hypothetical protein
MKKPKPLKVISEELKDTGMEEIKKMIKKQEIQNTILKKIIENSLKSK